MAGVTDDFVVLAKSERQAQEAWTLVERVLAELGLTLSLEKTQVTRFARGFSFLGFFISSWSVRMRDKSVEKFKDKVRALTQRHRNLDAEVVEKLNRVIRGTANYFAAKFARCLKRFEAMDEWIRMRLRCMRTGRKSRSDNSRIRRRHFDRLGVVRLVDFCHVV